MAKVFKFEAIEVKQTPNAKPFYLLQEDASNILEWCGVPRKQEEFWVGYQRQLNERHQDITDFLKLKDKSDSFYEWNILPSSIIVAARSENIKVSHRGSGGACVDIEVTLNESDFKERYHLVLNELKRRLGAKELESIEIPRDSDLESSNDDDSDAPPQSYLSEIVGLLIKGGEDLKGLVDEGQQKAIHEYIVDVTKPGLILDGQHRVQGAKNVSEFGVKLPVVLLPGMAYSEQVFHFYVLNNKARPLKKTELRAIVSSSLSSGEIDSLYNRFKQAGITAEETEWAFKMHRESNSPFFNLIDYQLGEKRCPIGENVAHAVVSRFVKPKSKYNPLFDNVPEWGGTNYEFRLKIFFSFWQAVKDKYPTAWGKAVDGTGLKQILQKVNLLVLQEYLFDQFLHNLPRRRASKLPEPFSGEAIIYQEVQLELAYLSEDFYLRPWLKKGLDTGPGHQYFRTQLQDCITNQSTNLGNRGLFKNA